MKKEKERFTSVSYDQRRAIYLLIAHNKDYRSIAKELEISVKTLKEWMEMPAFKKMLEKRMAKIEKFNSLHRNKANALIAEEFYKELGNRITDGRTIKRMTMPMLLKAVSMLNNELRQENKIGVNKNTEKVSKKDKDDALEHISETYHNNKAKKTDLTLVSMPNEEEDRNVG